MNKEELVLSLIDKLLNSSDNSSKTIEEKSESVFIWKYVILRCRNAGVHFWKLEYAKNWIYRLSESRRLYRWRIKDQNWVSLSELAEKGIDNEYSKICIELKLIEISERDWWELIPVNEWVINSFKDIEVFIP